jgi:hypothetical protein
MRVVFVECGGQITASWVSDNVAVGETIMMVLQDGVRRGEVVAEVSQQTYGGPLPAKRKQFYEEIFNLGRQYERRKQKAETLQAIADICYRQ